MRYFVADAFASGPFTGNPAGVCVPDAWPDDRLMRSIAAQNNLSETAFAVREGPGRYGIRWFTPVSEVDLCGHATLAAAYIITRFYEDTDTVVFSSKSGRLAAERRGGSEAALFALDFPTRKPVPIAPPPGTERALGVPALEAHASRDLILLLENEEAVRRLTPDMELLAGLCGDEYPGVCVTARGAGCDFVSRYFAPLEGIPEDPVTGSAHASLTPFWAERLNKAEMTAMQLSRRGGSLYVRDMGERTEIAGRARLYLEGEIYC